MKRHSLIAAAVLVCGVLAGWGPALAQESDIAPPPNAFFNGQPVRTMKTLNQVEPRVAVKELPFHISQPGSYYVTDNLTGHVAQSGITIDADDVRLDLGGFALIGHRTSLDGITVMNGRMNVTIQNGVIREWGMFGVNASNAYDSTLTGVRVYTNSLGGMTVGHNSEVSGCAAYMNGGEGIHVGNAGTVRDCKAGQNVMSGMIFDTATLVTDCNSSGNMDNGFVLGDYCTIRNCTAVGNGGSGIVASQGCRVEQNNCGQNGLTVGDGAGVLALGRGNRIEGNNLMGNVRGIDASIGSGNLIIRNSAADSVIMNYEIGPDNMHGE